MSGADLRFRHRTVTVPGLAEIADIQPVETADRQVWIVWTRNGELLRLDLDDRSVIPLPSSQLAGGETRLDILLLSPDGRLGALVGRQDEYGLVFDLDTGRPTMPLGRGDYHNEHSTFPVAFCVLEGRLVLVHGVDWNRLDVSDPRTGERLTERVSPTSSPQSEHYLDYFHCRLVPSPDHEYLAQDGWAWHPSGVVTTWSLRNWLHGNVWESEDGPSRRELCNREGHWWDRPLCWLGPRRLAVSGLGEEAPGIAPGVRIFDVTTGAEEEPFPGPSGVLFFDDGCLVSSDPERGVDVWDPSARRRLLHDPDLCPTRYHRAAKSFLTVLPEGMFRISKLVGHAFPAAWRTADVLRVARGIWQERAFADLPVLADALIEAGCDDAALLAHCRQPGAHGAECWALDRILGE
jgi:hypothetical protein